MRGEDGFSPVELACMGEITGWKPVGAEGIYEAPRSSSSEAVRTRVPGLSDQPTPSRQRGGIRRHGMGHRQRSVLRVPGRRQPGHHQRSRDRSIRLSTLGLVCRSWAVGHRPPSLPWSGDASRCSDAERWRWGVRDRSRRPRLSSRGGRTGAPHRSGACIPSRHAESG